ncbi:MAG: response regulator [Pseudomonadota bacterium]
MKILAVDDDQTALDIIRATLTAGGYDRVETVLSARAAREKIAAADTPFDCILLDVEMPETDGIELCAEIREMPEYEHLPIIMVTAVAAKEKLHDAMAAGATDYVNKPFDGLELGARMRAASILSSALKTQGGQATEAEKVAPAPIKGNDFRLSDPIALDSAPGMMSMVELSRELLEPRSNLRNARAFVLRMAGAADLYPRLTNAQFRSFLEKAGANLTRALMPWKGRVAYVGNGLFQVILFKGRGLKSESVKDLVISRVTSVSYTELADTRVELGLEFKHVPVKRLATGSDVLLSLAQTTEWCRLTGAGANPEESLALLRSHFRGEKTGGEEPDWVAPFFRHRAQSGPRIFPRRIVPSIRAAALADHGPLGGNVESVANRCFDKLSQSVEQRAS